MIWMPTVDNLLALHTILIQESGGMDGARDMGLIESALFRAYSGFGSESFYPDVISKAAVVCHSLVCNHGFIDGNKRIGIAAMLLILRKNSVRLRYTQAELIDLGLRLADGRMDYESVRAWINAHVIETPE